MYYKVRVIDPETNSVFERIEHADSEREATENLIQELEEADGYDNLELLDISPSSQFQAQEAGKYLRRRHRLEREQEHDYRIRNLQARRRMDPRDQCICSESDLGPEYCVCK